MPKKADQVDQGLQELLDELADLKAEKTRVEEHLAETQAELIDYMKSQGIKTIESSKHKGTLVEGQRVKIDEDRLAELLPKRLWDLITKQVVDTKKLEDAVATGSIDVEIVAEASTNVPVRPYVRVS